MTDRQAATRLYLAVGCGAAIGSLTRFLSGYVVVSLLGLNALWSTAFVNIVGSWVIMAFATLTGPDGRMMVGPVSRNFVMAGFCGGLTTFSAMSLDTFILLFEDDLPLAATYLISVVGLSLVAAWLGYLMASRLNRLPKGSQATGS
ncbi:MULTISPECIES: fluoride efflux transporter CrcB [unclassified Mesorhizobium]|uniref:fluoride efflux transporter CrcB n=1 Tax=unclassified Mesorhizobium TaxID=325217 RepID=UPI000F753769|nr:MULTISPECIES: fluoride efflux transporter CrcB [unclassified Mesorhizobium]AZO06278.1 fluoride efflux transporter CrcB [Mesorhizobium sp. M2A.F.Ca.ET.043.02.1.1]RUW40017.1 fluoride efflux transporter CrcB [Mesorhizobium sp. M2A.F.Ca.ET.015.02.1.1]RUW79100.1 fluoride efflux transporter CrcB [Mesorhizobium sp. M2A.F.Ca.ET.067.02.1.1]RVC91885.1 fluoride efflux transporter CrcB [Mesorhizobium sp. M2A.F.Ca.ET.017.03.2.1]RVD03798.1 fluoride efflux transporter CrcB [Mesorhizobium sp. M2A.F.Ca.ET.0